MHVAADEKVEHTACLVHLHPVHGKPIKTSLITDRNTAECYQGKCNTERLNASWVSWSERAASCIGLSSLLSLAFLQCVTELCRWSTVLMSKATLPMSLRPLCLSTLHQRETCHCDSPSSSNCYRLQQSKKNQCVQVCAEGKHRTS